MDAGALISAVSTLGFPIVCCGVLLWYIKYLTDKHDNEMTTLTTAIANNTKVIARLCEKLDGENCNDI